MSQSNLSSGSSSMTVHAAFIIGCGPAGVSIAYRLGQKDVPYVLVEREHRAAPLWRNYTYDSVKLQLHKDYCELLDEPVPKNLTNKQFVEYIDRCMKKFNINPQFNEKVTFAKFDEQNEYWKIVTESTKPGLKIEKEYHAFMLVVATGLNCEARSPIIKGIKIEKYTGNYIHSKYYKNGEEYKNKKVGVIGAGNSGIDISLDLKKHKATVYTVVKDLREKKIMPGRIAAYDLANVQGNSNASQYSDIRGPEADIFAMPEITKCKGNRVYFENERYIDTDSIILAIGYETDVLKWLKGSELFDQNGFPTGWKGNHRLYAGGFSPGGLEGVRMDADSISNDVWEEY